MAVYNVSTPEDFLDAVSHWGAEVNCADNTFFDFTEIGSQIIYLNAGIIRGNNSTFKNMTIRQIITSKNGITPTTEINNCTFDSVEVAPKYGAHNKNSLFTVDSTRANYDATITFTNCKISIHLDENTQYIGRQYSNLQNHQKAHINFYASSINFAAERDDFEISPSGGYAHERGEAIINFECCNMKINIPFVTNGAVSTDCYHKKCLIYYYMPMWNGYMRETPSGSEGLNPMKGEQYASCVIRGNLTALNGASDITPQEAKTWNISVLCANLGSEFYNPSGVWHIRVGTEEQARDPDWLLTLTLFTWQAFDLVLENPLPVDWQIDPTVNDGLPFIEIMPEIIRIQPIIRSKNKLRIYDMMSTQNQLNTNGLAILDAFDVTIHEVLNGEYSLTFSHPIDENEKWKYIKESNIVKCQDQYFTIISCVWNYTSKNTGVITANCEHVFYQLNDLWIFPENVPTISYHTCKAVLDQIMGAAQHYDDQTMRRYLYEWASDWDFGAPFMFTGMDEGFTPVNGFLGSNGIVGLMGGELYRDNFYFSINKRMENANENAFDIRFGNNAANIKRTVDSSSLCTFFKMYDTETGSWLAVSYSNDGYPLFQFPHTIARSINYTFSQQVYEEVERGYIDIFDIMYPVMMHLWESTGTPILCYEVELSDYTKHGVYGIDINQNFKVGDSGRIHDSLLGVDVNIRITETEKDGLTGKTKKVTFGSKHSFTRASGYPKPFDGDDTPVVETVMKFRDKDGNYLKDKDEYNISGKVVI